MPQLDLSKSSFVCKARVEPSTLPLGQCSKWMMMQRHDICCEQMSVKLMVRSSCETVTVYAFGKTVYDLAQLASNEVATGEALLGTPVIRKLTYNSDKVITDYTRD